jgi:hypothetical protein
MAQAFQLLALNSRARYASASICMYFAAQSCLLRYYAFWNMRDVGLLSHAVLLSASCLNAGGLVIVDTYMFDSSARGSSTNAAKYCCAGTNQLCTNLPRSDVVPPEGGTELSGGVACGHRKAVCTHKRCWLHCTVQIAYVLVGARVAHCVWVHTERMSSFHQ